MAKSKQNFSFDVVKKNLFWIGVPLAIVAMWVVFIIANNNAKANYNKRKDELESLKKSVGDVKSNAAHPNQNTIADIQLNVNELRKKVFAAWERMYDEQKKYFVWSPEIGAQFVRKVQEMKRFDSFPSTQYLEWYNTFVERQLPEFLDIAKRRKVMIKKFDLKTGKPVLENGEEVFVDVDPFVINARQMMRANAKKLSSGGGMGMGMGGGSEMAGVGFGGGSNSGGAFGWANSGGTGGGMGNGNVSGMDNSSVSGMASTAGMSDSTLLFETANQKVAGIVDWPNPEIYGIVTWENTPTSDQIWIAQEDIWVYNSLIHIVRNINDRVKATGPHNAAIKRIQSMLIGKDASQIVRNPSILMPLGPLTGGGMAGGDMDDGMIPSDTSLMGSGSGLMDDGGMSAAPLTEEDKFKYLKRNRYVDLEMKPLGENDAPPMAEVNIMPVCLDLIVDQRRVSDILVECANSPMPIDVKLVRYSPGMAQTGVLGIGLASGMDGGMSGSSAGIASGGSTGGMSGGNASGMSGGDTSALDNFDVGGKIGPYGSDAVNIQIIGVIYIYNEPDKNKLATGASAQNSGIEGGIGDETTPAEGETPTAPTETETITPAEEASPESDAGATT
ncbi:MAG: hypothetical protein LBT05_06095 [Planctomycetaceae bacterium]|jgi:uncharacterized membrane protein YgcG|nr:hypothetical protein [Planctomycetaceae bacterium]